MVPPVGSFLVGWIGFYLIAEVTDGGIRPHGQPSHEEPSSAALGHIDGRVRTSPAGVSGSARLGSSSAVTGARKPGPRAPAGRRCESGLLLPEVSRRHRQQAAGFRRSTAWASRRSWVSDNRSTSLGSFSQAMSDGGAALPVPEQGASSSSVIRLGGLPVGSIRGHGLGVKAGTVRFSPNRVYAAPRCRRPSPAARPAQS